jgi:hypothetical protein
MLQGGLAGSSAWAVVFPADVVKSRLQAGGLSTGDAAAAARRSLLTTVRGLYKAGGIAVFYNGASAAICRAFPANGALFLGYEMSMKVLNQL